jgi:hypothetical protein
MSELAAILARRRSKNGENAENASSNANLEVNSPQFSASHAKKTVRRGSVAALIAKNKQQATTKITATDSDYKTLQVGLVQQKQQTLNESNKKETVQQDSDYKKLQVGLVQQKQQTLNESNNKNILKTDTDYLNMNAEVQKRRQSLTNTPQKEIVRTDNDYQMMCAGVDKIKQNLEVTNKKHITVTDDEYKTILVAGGVEEKKKRLIDTPQKEIKRINAASELNAACTASPSQQQAPPVPPNVAKIEMIETSHQLKTGCDKEVVAKKGGNPWHQEAHLNFEPTTPASHPWKHAAPKDFVPVIAKAAGSNSACQVVEQAKVNTNPWHQEAPDGFEPMTPSSHPWQHAPPAEFDPKPVGIQVDTYRQELCEGLAQNSGSCAGMMSPSSCDALALLGLGPMSGGFRDEDNVVERQSDGTMRHGGGIRVPGC